MMPDGFVTSTVRKMNIRMLILGLTGLGIVLVLGILNFRYLSNLVLGPAEIDRTTLKSLADAKSLERYYVTITGDDTADTGFSYVTTSDSGSETTDAYYLALLIDERILLVESKSSEIDLSVTGALENISSELRAEVIDTLESEVPEIEGMFLPVMLNNSSFAGRGTVGFVAAGIISLLSLFGIGLSLYRLAVPEGHPAIKALSRFGEPERVAREIDMEMAMAPAKVGKQVNFTSNWMVSTKNGLNIVPYRDAVWCYKQVTQHRTNGIPTGKTYAATIYDRHGKQLSIQGKEAEVDEILQNLTQRTPGIVTGFSDELSALWSKERSRFVSAVDQRRSGNPQ